MKIDKKPLSIYIHIPFCVQKCLYCDFLSAPADDERKEAYLQALLVQIREEAKKYAAYSVETVFIGGGTPSVLPAESIERLLKVLREFYDVAENAEISIEVNPGTVSKEKLAVYRKAGVNRLSIGLQSANNRELKLLGRIHTLEDFLQTYKNAIKSGFNNINIDLMSAIPQQTKESYRETLQTILGLEPPPTHISAYSLIIEEGTPFFENLPELPDEETDRELYKITNDILKENGYHRYEISNYAKPGFECRHNKVYWQRGNYAGFGIGAASLIENVRFSNISDIRNYVNHIDEFTKRDLKYEKNSCEWKNVTDLIYEAKEVLSVEEHMEEFMFLGLRLTEGVSKEEFCRTFGREMDEVYPGIIKRFEEQKLMVSVWNEEKKETFAALTEYGLDVSNVVMAEFLLK